jgi:hypothetical protein
VVALKYLAVPARYLWLGRQTWSNRRKDRF